MPGISVEISTKDHLPRDRFAVWRNFVSSMIAPVEMRTENPAAFNAAARLLPLGEVTFAESSSDSLEAHRSARMIRQSDPEAYLFSVVLAGRAGIEQSRRQVEAGVRDLVLCDTSRPLRGWAAADDGPAVGLMLVVPRSSLPLPAKAVQRLVATRLPAGTAVGRLLTAMLTDLANTSEACTAADAARLSPVVVDLLSAYLAGLLDRLQTVPAETREAALLASIETFIGRHVGDPRLTPATIAAAHHISVRYLHKVYAGGETIAARIRRLRLEGSRRDLADPLWSDRPVRGVAARWGFENQSHFARLFKAAYGSTPTDFRAEYVRPTKT